MVCYERQHGFVVLIIFHTFVAKKIMEKIIITKMKTTPGYATCFRDDCPRAEECLRHLYGKNLPQDRLIGPTIYPTVPIRSYGCQFFKTSEPKIMAWGFSTLFEDVRHRHVVPMRKAMHKYLGSERNYYRYHRGDRTLSPEQQQWICNLFNEYGYTRDVVFDHYAEAYDFDH